MALPVYRYPLDPTGENPDNLVVREPHQLNKKTNPTFVRVTCPLYGPFFAESVVILDASNGRQLVKDIDYKCTDLLQDPTLSFGKEISQFIVITNGEVSDELEISYQVLGGNYQNDATAVQHVFETFLNDDRTVDWSNVGNKPATYPPSLHLHLLQDIINFGPLVVAINSLRDAKMLNNTPMFEALVNWVTDRKTTWAELIGKPTTSVQAGLTDVVTLGGAQTIQGSKTFNYLLANRGSEAYDPDANTKSVIATDNQVKRAEARLVPKTTIISAGGGLTGGGDLSTNRDIAIGTPTTIRYGVNNGVTEDSHVHAIDTLSLIGNSSDKFAAGNDTRIVNAVQKSRQIIAGNGVTGGGALDTDRTITLGTPSTITASTSNAVTADSHSHKLDIPSLIGTTADKLAAGNDTRIVNAVPKSRIITSGNGLIGGGTLESDRTISLGTPSDISSGSSNTVSTTSHSHKLDIASLIGTTGDKLAAGNDSRIVNAVNKLRSVYAGLGLSGGGSLSQDLIISLGIPSTISRETDNVVYGSTHTHAIDLDSLSQFKGGKDNGEFTIGELIIKYGTGPLVDSNNNRFTQSFYNGPFPNAAFFVLLSEFSSKGTGNGANAGANLLSFDRYGFDYYADRYGDDKGDIAVLYLAIGK